MGTLRKTKAVVESSYSAYGRENQRIDLLFLWKIMQGTQAGACWMGPQYPNGTADPACSTVIDCGHGCLFCLTADPTEHHDLAASHPAALQFMQATLHKMQHGFFDPTRDGGNKSVPIQAAIEYGGFWGPFLQ